jgi:hypothetical protein
VFGTKRNRSGTRSGIGRSQSFKETFYVGETHEYFCQKE